jgi:hypothetical protein
MMSRIPILLDEKTAAGLVVLAKQEYRDPRQQAAVIIRDELLRRGLLQADPTPPVEDPKTKGENDATQ